MHIPSQHLALYANCSLLLPTSLINLKKLRRKSHVWYAHIHPSRSGHNFGNAESQDTPQDGLQLYRQLESTNLQHHHAPHSLCPQKAITSKAKKRKPWRSCRQEATGAYFMPKTIAHEPRLGLDSLQQLHQAITWGRIWYYQTFWVL